MKYEYENRIVAFIDLLGFKSAIKEKTCEDIAYAIMCFHSLTKIKNPFAKTRRITQFSDSIVISAQAEEPSAVFFLLVDIQQMIGKLIAKGFLCRGGISIGKLIHNNRFLFGEGMVSAYQMESKTAKYPRVIVENEVISLAHKHHAEQNLPEEELQYVKEIVTQDDDGFYYIDYFEKIVNQFDYIQNVSGYLINLKNQIDVLKQENLNDKYKWLLQKYNHLLKKLKQGIPYKEITGEDDTLFNKYVNEIPFA